MPRPLENNSQRYGMHSVYSPYYVQGKHFSGSRYSYAASPYVKRQNVRKFKTKQKKKINPIRALVSLCFFALVVYYVIPHNIVNFFEPMILNRFLNRNITFNAKDYVLPTLNYLSNAEIMGEKLLVPVRTKNREMVPLTPSSRMYELEGKLNKLALAYPKLKPSIYVWDYVSSQSAEISPGAVYSSASIIKLPILVELFRKSEALKKIGKEPVDFNSKLLFDEIYKTDGSGNLQFEKTGKYYTLDYLSRIMIQSSDNSATNMLLEYIGGMDALNAASRKWGLKSTGMHSWLPDLSGTNKVSAKDMATLLYNIDNPNFLNEHSRYMIKQYMSNVHNTTLLKAGLPNNAEILHKTGDIATMLGDAGIVYAKNGKKYIAVILVERPYNDYSARNFIQQASKIIYDFIVSR